MTLEGRGEKECVWARLGGGLQSESNQHGVACGAALLNAGKPLPPRALRTINTEMKRVVGPVPQRYLQITVGR